MAQEDLATCLPRQDIHERQDGHHKSSVFVEEGVYLVNRTAPLILKNLLSNSLSFKVRRSMSGEPLNKSTVMDKLRGDSRKDERDNGHHRQYMTDLNNHNKNKRIKTESNQLMKQQEQSTRTADGSKRNQARLGSNWTKEKPFGEFPPIYKNHLSSGRDHSSVTPSDHSHGPIYSHSTFLADDDACMKAAMDAVKFTNNKGIFLPNDKYPASRYAYRHAPSPSPSGETILLGRDGASTKASRRSGKGLHVTWSANSDSAIRRESDIQTPWNPKSLGVKCNSVRWQKVPFKSKRSKIEYIGVQWSTSQDKKSPKRPEIPRSHSSISGRVSKNVLPVTIGLDHRGTSVSKTKWIVPTSSKQDATQQWLNGLNFVKQPTAKERYLESRMFRPHTENSSQIIFERTESEVRE